MLFDSVRPQHRTEESISIIQKNTDLSSIKNHSYTKKSDAIDEQNISHDQTFSNNEKKKKKQTSSVASFGLDYTRLFS